MEKGYFGDETSGRDIVAWCSPRTFHIVDPVVEPKAWKLNQLPFFPALEDLQPSSPEAQASLSILVELVRNSDRIICATEATAEGQLLFNDLITYARQRLSTPIPDAKLYRIWPNVKTRESVRSALKNPFPNDEFKHLLKSAQLRRWIDWSAQYNYSKLYTLLYSRHSAQIFQLDRVQLLLLKQVTERYLERREFKPKPFYEVNLECLVQGIGVVFKWTKSTSNLTPYDPRTDGDDDADSNMLGSSSNAHSNHTINSAREEATTISETKPRNFLKRGSRHQATDSKEEAYNIANSIEPASIIVASRTETLRQPPPLLYNLTSLQREAYERYSIPPSATHLALIALYEKYGLITNPNTASHQVPISKISEVESLHTHFASLKKYSSLVKPFMTRERFESRDMRVFEVDIKDSETHAILPLIPPSSSSNSKTRREGITPIMTILFDMIIRRFLASFLPDMTHTVITVTLENADKYYFEAKAAIVKSEGWKSVGSVPKAKAPFNPGPANFPTGYIPSSVTEEDESAQEEMAEHKQLFRILSSLRLGEEVKGIIPAEVVTKEPSPPPLYTQSSILALMEDKVTIVNNSNASALQSSQNALSNDDSNRRGINTSHDNSSKGEEDDDSEDKNGDFSNFGKNVSPSGVRLKFDAGLGTPEQRADYLTKLMSSKWFRRRQDRYIEPTRKGILLVKLIQEDAIVEASHSHSWDNSLALIAKGRGSRGSALIKRFRSILEPDISKHVNSPDWASQDMLPPEVAYDIVYYHTHTSHVKALNENPSLSSTKCPKCGHRGYMKQGPSAYFCSYPTCNFSLAQVIAKRLLTIEEAKLLFSKKMTDRVSGLTDNAGNTFEANLVLHLPTYQLKFVDKVITKAAEPKQHWKSSREAVELARRRNSDEALGSSRIVSVLSGPGRPTRGTAVVKVEKPKLRRGRPPLPEEVVAQRMRERVDRMITRNIARQQREEELREKRENPVVAPEVRVTPSGEIVPRVGRPRLGEYVPPKIKKNIGRPRLTEEELAKRMALKKPRGRPTKASLGLQKYRTRRKAVPKKKIILSLEPYVKPRKTKDEKKNQTNSKASSSSSENQKTSKTSESGKKKALKSEKSGKDSKTEKMSKKMMKKESESL